MVLDGLPPTGPLTPRQREVMLALLRGATRKQAARELGISSSTVRAHTYRACQRLDVANVMQAAAVMLREGWVEVDDILADYEGARYSTDDQHGKNNWWPSPAQRLYLDAFDRLCAERAEEAAARLDVFGASLFCESRAPDYRRGARDIDAVLLKLARALAR